MHALCNQLSQFLSIMLALFVQHFCRFQSLLVVIIHRQG